MWRVYKDARRPWPKMDDDPVIDYMLMEAVALKAADEQRKAEEAAAEEAKRKQWRTRTTPALEALR